MADAGATAKLAAIAGCAVLGLVAVALSGCAEKPRVDPKLGVAASPRVVETGKPVPKGGGVAKVGGPYTVAGKTFTPMADPKNYSAEGLASWYGSAFHGRMTANGEVFDMTSLSAAHPTLPLPSYARVTNTSNGKSIIVRVNDRGPFHGNRAVDVSERVAEMLDFKRRGMARVRIDYVGPASLKGSDQGKLLASFRSGNDEPGMATTAVASVEPKAMSIPSPAGTKPEPSQDLRGAIAQAPAPSVPATPVVAETATTPSTEVASRIDAGFAGVSSSQPLIRPGSNPMVQPVLSGFAFSPSALGR